MAAGSCDFVIEPGTDWAAQVYWVSEQTNNAIRGRGPMDMDILDPRTGQRLIRLDNGANGGIDAGGAGQGVIQLQIARDMTIKFAAGSYVYDLFVFAVGPPLARVRLLAGRVIVPNPVTWLGTQRGIIVDPGLPNPDIILDVRYVGNQVRFNFDITLPINAASGARGNAPEQGVPLRAGLRGAGSFPAATVVYVKEDTTTGPMRNAYGNDITSATVNTWLAAGSIITVTFNDQFGGLVVSRVESAPGSAPSPTIT